MKFLEIARLILSLLPVLIQAIRAAEEAIPGEGKGELKLAIIRAALESAYSAATDVIGTFDSIWPAIQNTIGIVVGAYNKAGIFKK